MSINHSFVIENVGTEWHQVGTASLGPLGEGGVVASDLIVYGTSNLRVVDARSVLTSEAMQMPIINTPHSIMPMQIGAHIQATVYAIAEKVSVNTEIIFSGFNKVSQAADIIKAAQ